MTAKEIVSELEHLSIKDLKLIIVNAEFHIEIKEQSEKNNYEQIDED